jgi:ankyrin repeat protein
MTGVSMNTFLKRLFKIFCLAAVLLITLACVMLYRHILSDIKHINAKDKDGLTPLHYAARNNQKHEVKLLLAKGANVNAKDNEGFTPLHWAAQDGYKDVAELLLAHGADVNAREFGITIQFDADMMNGVALPHKDDDGQTPLHFAYRHKDVAELLLAKGADVNAKDKNGTTPLDVAATMCQKDTVELLLAKGADVNATDNDGWTALHVARNKTVAELLLAKGANVNAKTIKDNWTPLHYVTWNGPKDVAELLLAKGADVNTRDNNGDTPLHAAVHFGRKEMAELLLANKSDVNAKDKDGKTPMKVAKEKGSKDMVKLLRQHGGHSAKPSLGEGDSK